MPDLDPNTAVLSLLSGRTPKNPLPSGMRDLLPPDAQNQSLVGRRILRTFELHGYQRVWLPTFEYAEVLERSRSLNGSALKFVEPESGEIVALRSDMTPQIARVVSTRFADAPLPVRLCYQGSVLRRRHERARTESQVVQAGIELVGEPGQAGDFEVMSVLCAATRAARIQEFVLDIGHAEVAASLLRGVAQERLAEMNDALSHKDATALERAGREAGLAKGELSALVTLPELHGAEDLWPRARKALGGTPAEPHMLELEALWQRIRETELAPTVIADLGETREFGYYTGVIFHLLAHGPGEPIASGGRYDKLYQKFGAARTAAGFAIDLNHLCWAMQTAGVRDVASPRIVAGPDVEERLLTALRERGLGCCRASNPESYAAFWHCRFALLTKSEGVPTGTLRVLDSSSGRYLEISEVEVAKAATKIAEFAACGEFAAGDEGAREARHAFASATNSEEPS